MSEWKNLEDYSKKAPRPDLKRIQAMACEQCKSLELKFIFKACTNGSVQFKSICTRCEHKSGALMHETTDENVKNFKMPFGKFKSQSLDAIYKCEPQYLEWCVNNLSSSALRFKIDLFLKAARID